jgi:20S proteasome subunit beta 2
MPKNLATQDPTEILLQNRGGFSFDNCKRNEMLEKTGMGMPGAMKTGTTIVGIVYKNGVVLGADTRATEGPIVCDKNCEKIHHISKRIWCCGAGTSADTEAVTGLISSQLELHRMATGQEPRVATACTRLKQHLFQYQGHVSAALVLGGVDATGSHLYTVYPHGSTDRLPYATMGSGSLAAMAEFEAHYRDDMDEKEAIDLVDRAIQAGIFNDLGSGGNVDIVVLDKNKPEPKILRGYKTDLTKRLYRREGGYPFPKGTTAWLKDTEKILKTRIEVTQMDTSS